jgi:hypothetical protein
VKCHLVITLLNVDVSRTLTFFVVSKPYSPYAKRNFLANARNNKINNKKILLQAIPTSKMTLSKILCCCNYPNLQHYFKNIISPTKLVQSTGVKQVTISPVQQYQKILIAHDGSEMSDKALRHALYLSKASRAELVIMNVIEAEVIPPSFVLAFMKPGVQART